MTTATGTFEITGMDEDAYRELGPGGKLTRARGTQRFDGDLEGEGSVEWLMCYAADGTARFLGLQEITGSIGGRSGSFVLEATGDHDGSRSKATWRVLEGTATGELAGMSGQGGFEAPGGPKGSFTLEYRLPT
ncbi:MAG TPA: DUF3224 domain-containing protein [Actinomycetota bacterium]|jgi:hypothetical protein